jgi:hypothetical protein
MNNGVETLSLRVCDTHVGVCSHNRDAAALLLANYSEMRVNSEPADIEYTIGKDSICNSFFIATKGGNSFKAEQDGEFLYLFDRELTIELQKLRKDLYFVHGAALEYEGKVCLLVGPSKSGKSVTTWALLNEGFGYLSDELAPGGGPKDLGCVPIPAGALAAASLSGTSTAKLECPDVLDGMCPDKSIFWRRWGEAGSAWGDLFCTPSPRRPETVVSSRRQSRGGGSYTC